MNRDPEAGMVKASLAMEAVLTTKADFTNEGSPLRQQENAPAKAGG